MSNSPEPARKAAGPARRRRGRPPGGDAELRTAILDAARDELCEVGYGDFRIDRVAVRAGAHRATVYRQWGSRAALARDAVIEWQIVGQPLLAETGDWETDLRGLLHAVDRYWQSEPSLAIARTLVEARREDPALVDALQEVWQREVPPIRGLIRRAHERGDLDPSVDPDTILELVTAAFAFRAVISGTPIDDDFVESLYRIVLEGTRKRGRRRRSS